MTQSLLRATVLSALLCLMPLAVPSVVALPEALLRPHKRVAAEYEEVLERLVASTGILLRPDGGSGVVVCGSKAAVCGKLAVS